MPEGRLNNKLVLVFLLFFSIGINIYFRLQTLFLPDIEKKARQEVHDVIHEELSRQIKSFYPDTPDIIRIKLYDELVNSYLRENSAKIKKDIAEKSRELKSEYLDEQGWPYLLETDSFRWLRRIRNYLNTGRFGTSVREGKEYDDLEFAPQGDRIEPLKIHYYLGAFFFKFLRFFHKGILLEHSLILYSLILSVFLIVVIFFVCGCFGMSYPMSFLASLYIGLAPIVINRSTIGWFDTDLYNLLFPLAIIGMLAHYFKKRYSRRSGPADKLILLSCGVLFGIYSSLWNVWWMMFYMILSGVIFYQISVIIYDKGNAVSYNLKQAVLETAILAGSSYLFVLFISGLEVLKNSFLEPAAYFFLREGVAIDGFWPNVGFSVSELARSEIIHFMEAPGGALVLYGGLIGLLIVLFYKRMLTDIKDKAFILDTLFIWMISMFIMAYFGIRFLLFLIIPVIIFLFAALDYVIEFFTLKENKLGRIKPGTAKVIIICAVVFLLGGVKIKDAYDKRNNYTLLNDLMLEMCNDIKKITPPDAIINGGWTEGDWIMTIAHRATIQDSHYQYTPVAYWFSRAIMNKNEEEAVAIFRMINSAGNRAFDELCKVFNGDKLSAFELVERMLNLDEEKSRELLSEYTGDSGLITKIMESMYGPPMPQFLFLYYFMIDRMEYHGNLSQWDFRRFHLWNKFRELKKDKNKFLQYARERFGYSVQEAETLYQEIVFVNKKNIKEWLSPNIYSFYTSFSKWKSDNPQTKVMLFDNGLAINKDTLNAYWRNGKDWMVPGRIIFVSQSNIEDKKIESGDKDFTVLLFKKDNVYKSTLMTNWLADSLFVKLFFMDARGLKHFKQVIHKSKDDAKNMYLYKIE